MTTMRWSGTATLALAAVVLASGPAAAEVGYLDQVSLVAWGKDTHGEVSDTPAGYDFVQAACGGSHCLALRFDGSIAGWGEDWAGQATPPPGTGFTKVAAGSTHSLALGPDGRITSWGFDADGEVSETPTGTGFVQIDAGKDHSVALKADGHLVAWGGDTDDQVSHTPMWGGFTQVAAGYGYSMALDADGFVLSWGDENVVEDSPAGSGFTATSGASSHALALRADGSIAAWGMDWLGQVSDTPAGTGFTKIDGGTNHSLALRDDGSIIAWGSDSRGQVSGTPTSGYFFDIAADGSHNLALKARETYDDLLVTGTDRKVLLQRNVTVGGNAVIDTLMTVGNGAVMTVGGTVICQPGAGLALIVDIPGLGQGDTVQVFDAAAWSDSFETFDLPPLPEGLWWETSTLYTDGTLTVLPEPATLALLAVGSLVLIRRRTRRQRR